MARAKADRYVVFTNDLDFSALPAATRAEGPSVAQIRTQDLLPKPASALLLQVVDDHREAPESGPCSAWMKSLSEFASYR